MSITSQIAAATAGDTITIAPGTYNERVIVNKALTINMAGVIIDGTGLGVPLQQGLLSIQAGPTTINGGRATNSGGAGIDVSGGFTGGATINDFEADHNVQEGYHGSSTDNVTFNRLKTHHNDESGTTYSGGEQGGGKHANCNNWTFVDCQAYNNGGPGIWADIYCTNSQYIRCIVHDNLGAGIMHEASHSATLDSCKGWMNGLGNAGWAWDCNFLISSSENVEVKNCISAWANGGLTGISLIAQSRSTDYPDIKPYEGLNVHDNVVINTSSSKLITWPEPDKSSFPTAVFDTPLAANNSYYPAFASDDPMPGPNTETGKVLLTQAQAQDILAANSMPSSPGGEIPQSGYQSTVLADSPIGYWRLDETSGTTAADLGSGSHVAALLNDFTLDQPSPITSDPNSKSIRLNATTVDGQIKTTNYQLGDEFTIEAWVKLVSLTGTADPFIFTMSGSGNSPDLKIAVGNTGVTDGVVYLAHPNGDVARSTIPINDGNWHHVVATKNGTDTHIYVDGIDVTSLVTNSTYDAVIGSGNAFWGVNPSGTGSNLVGYVDELALYTTALSAVQVQNHYAAATSSTTVFGTFTANAQISTASGTTHPGSFTADARIKATTSGSFTANAQIGTTQSGSEQATAFRIIVYAADQQTVVWDSGDINQSAAGSFSKTYNGPTLQKGARYFWKARYTKSTGATGDYSPLESFHINADPSVPSGLEPSTGSIVPNDLTPTFQATFEDADKTAWGDAPSKIEVEVYRNSDSLLMYTLAATSGLSGGTNQIMPGGSGVTQTAGPGGTALAYETEYKWRARYTDSRGVAGSWSSYNVFKPSQTPTTNISAPGAVVNSPSFAIDWSMSSPAGKSQGAYQVRVLRASDEVAVYDTGKVIGSQSSFTLPSGYLVNSTDYTIEVTTWDTDDLSSLDTSTASTDWTAPDPPDDFTAVADISTSTITLSWNESALAAEDFSFYQLYVRKLGDTDWTQLATITSQNVTSYQDFFAANEQIYEYKVTVFQKVPGDVDLESPDSTISAAILDADTWFVIGADRSPAHSFELPVSDAPFQEPIQQEAFEPLGDFRRKTIMRGKVLGAEGTLTCIWTDEERATALVQLDYIRDNEGPHILKSPFGDVWQVEFSGPSKDYKGGGGLEVQLAFTEVV